MRKINPYTTIPKEQLKLLYALESKNNYYSDILEEFETDNNILSSRQYEILRLLLELKKLNHSCEIDNYDYVIVNLSTLEKSLGIANKNIDKYMKKLKSYALLDWNAIKIKNAKRQYDTLVKFDSKGIIKLLNCIQNGINKNSPLLKGLKKGRNDNASLLSNITQELEKYQSLIEIKESNNEIKNVMYKVKKGFIKNLSLEVLTEIVVKSRQYTYVKHGTKIEIAQEQKCDENYYISVIENGISGLFRLKLKDNIQNLENLIEKYGPNFESDFVRPYVKEEFTSKDVPNNIYLFYLIYNKLKFIISNLKNINYKNNNTKTYSSRAIANIITDCGYINSVFDTDDISQSVSCYLNSLATPFSTITLEPFSSLLLEQIKTQKENFLKYSAGTSKYVHSLIKESETKLYKLVYNFVSGGVMKKPKDFVEQETKQNKSFEQIEEQVESAYKIWNEKDNFSDRREKQIAFITPHLVNDEVKLKCVIDFIDLRKPKSLDFQEELFFIAKHNSIIPRKTFTNRFNEVKKAEQKNIHCKTLGIAKNSDILDKQDKLYYEESKSRLEGGIEGNKRKLENILTGEIIEIIENDKNDYLETLFLDGENRQCKISKNSDIYTITYRNKELKLVSNKYKEIM